MLLLVRKLFRRTRVVCSPDWVSLKIDVETIAGCVWRIETTSFCSKSKTSSTDGTCWLSTSNVDSNREPAWTGGSVISLLSVRLDCHFFRLSAFTSKAKTVSGDASTVTRASYAFFVPPKYQRTSSATTSATPRNKNNLVVPLTHRSLYLADRMAVDQFDCEYIPIIYGLQPIDAGGRNRELGLIFKARPGRRGRLTWEFNWHPPAAVELIREPSRRRIVRRRRRTK